jgi:chromatin structure-remodeling complex subunit RSC1/2
LLAEKRKQDEAQLAERAEAAKRANVDNEKRFVDSVKDLGVKALETLEAQLAEATQKEFEGLFTQDVEKGMAAELERLAKVQKDVGARVKEVMRRREREAKEEESPIRGMTVLLEEAI